MLLNYLIRIGGYLLIGGGIVYVVWGWLHG